MQPLKRGNNQLTLLDSKKIMFICGLVVIMHMENSLSVLKCILKASELLGKILGRPFTGKITGECGRLGTPCRAR